MEFDMTTHEGRSAHLQSLLKDATLNLTVKEAYSHIYHTVMLEFLLNRRAKTNAKIHNHCKWLNDTEDVYRLRQEMHNW